MSKVIMARGMYHYLKQAWKKPDAAILRERMIEWRASDAVTRVDKPLRLDRARTLGYKDKVGFDLTSARKTRRANEETQGSKGNKVN